MQSCHSGRSNKGIGRLEVSLVARSVHANGDGGTQQGMTGIPAGQGMVPESPTPPQDRKLRIMPPRGMRTLPGSGASFAILTLGLIPIWLPAPDLLIDEEAVTPCFAHQVQTAGVNNELPSVFRKAGRWKTVSLGASFRRLRGQAF